MTESITSNTEVHDKTAALLAKGKEGGNAQSSAKAGGGNAPTKARSGSTLKVAVVVLALLTAGFGGAAWYLYESGQQAQVSTLQQLEQTGKALDEAGHLARQANAQLIAQGATLARLQTQVSDLQLQLGNLDQAFQALTDSGSDLVLLNDIDHLVSIASQQLTLGGNVANAIVALETAQARLSRANRPALAAVQQSLNGDLERLRAAAIVDVPALAAQLEQLNGLLGQAPLLVPDNAAPGVKRLPATQDTQARTFAPFQANAESAWWQNALDGSVHWLGQAWSVLSHDLAGFISVRRVDDRAALLISPEQADQLRLTLRLRIMTAQLALMMKQADVWKVELDAINVALSSHFDVQSPVTQRALRLATRLVDTPVDTRLPVLGQTQSALEAVRQESARAVDQRGGASSVTAEPASEASGLKNPSPAVEQPSAPSPVSAARSHDSQG